MLKKLFKDERGEDLVEYALLTAFIAVVAILAVKALGSKIVGIFNDIVTALS